MKNNVYLQAEHAVRYLINEFGTEVINDIIAETDSLKTFTLGFESVTGMTLGELDDKLNQNN